ncbi:hypothetical protein F4811DRAFT_369798 [Daldinia bambusicola]|nr:hypothetical protein F4811DRAFT_369798 [Daldinia bambusicola]
MGRKKLQITDLYIYPIKSLRPVSLNQATLRREGLKYDRRFMLLKAQADGDGNIKYENIQVYQFPVCALFHQALDGDHVVVTYHVPAEPLIVPPPPEQFTALRVPLDPTVDGLDTVDIELFGSNATAYRMGAPYDAWFSACLGYPAILVYIGDNRRAVLAHAPPQPAPPTQSQSQSWFSYLASYVPYYGQQQQQPKESGGGDGGLAFNEAAPFLVTSRASLRDVSARLSEGLEMDMIKFRPNIVVDEVWDDSPSSSGPEEEEENHDNSGEDGPSSSSILKAWEEDFWAELRVVSGGRSRSQSQSHAQARLALTANCARCVSINVDYAAGRRGTGELGAVLKKLMRDRRVDAGNKWSPIFGRYAFLLPSDENENGSSNGRGSDRGIDSGDDGIGGGGKKGDGATIGDLEADVAVGDEVEVTRRITERDTWAWPD